jgi:hypothetical protein
MLAGLDADVANKAPARRLSALDDPTLAADLNAVADLERPVGQTDFFAS